jgi:hypothetical protein
MEKWKETRYSLLRKNNSIFFVRGVIAQGNKKEYDASDRRSV